MCPLPFRILSTVPVSRASWEFHHRSSSGSQVRSTISPATGREAQCCATQRFIATTLSGKGNIDIGRVALAGGWVDIATGSVPPSCQVYKCFVRSKQSSRNGVRVFVIPRGFLYVMFTRPIRPLANIVKIKSDKCNRTNSDFIHHKKLQQWRSEMGLGWVLSL